MLRPTLLLSALLLAGTAHAADKPEAPAVKPGWTLLDDPGEPRVEQRVIEDDSTRIEELRVRGETRKITVQPKNSAAPAYEIIVGDASHDLSAGANTSRDTVGKRVWRVLDF